MKESKQIQEDIKKLAILEIKAAMKENKDLRMHERYQTILMMLHGEPYPQIVKMTGRSLATIYNYVKAYKEKGINGLPMEHSSGRPRQLTTEQEQQVYQMIIDQKPIDVGFPAEMNWTSPLVRKWMKQEWNIQYSDRGTRELLYRLKL